MALIQLVDENDQPLRGGTKQEAWQQGFYHRIVKVLLIDEYGRTFIQHRTPQKVPFPNHWDSSVAGHVDEGETYFEAAVRELQEETGIKAADLKEVEKNKIQRVDEGGRKLNRFIVTFICHVSSDTPIVIDRTEADRAQWITKAEGRALLKDKNEKLTYGLKHTLEKHFLNN